MFMQNRSLTAMGVGLALVFSASAGAQDRGQHSLLFAQASPTTESAAQDSPGLWRMPGGPAGNMSDADIDRMRQMMQQMGRGRGGAAMPQRAMRHFDRIEGQLAYFRAELRITEAQAPEWNAFAEAARTNARTLRQAFEQAMQPGAQPATGPAQMERHVTLLRRMADAAQAMSTAMTPLYNALSDEQKRTADELLHEHMRDMGRRGF